MASGCNGWLYFVGLSLKRRVKRMSEGREKENRGRERERMITSSKI